MKKGQMGLAIAQPAGSILRGRQQQNRTDGSWVFSERQPGICPDLLPSCFSSKSTCSGELHRPARPTAAEGMLSGKNFEEQWE